MPATRDVGTAHRPRRVRRPSATQRARSQQRSYVSQGRAVQRVAVRQRAAVRGPRQTPVQRARSQQRSYVSQGHAVPRAATQQRTAARTRQRAARQRYFSSKPVAAGQRKVNRGVLALSLLRAQDPHKYDATRRKYEFAAKHPLESDIKNSVGDAAGAANRVLGKTGEYLKHLQNQQTTRSNKLRLNAGVGPDPSKAGREVIDLVSNTPSGVYMTGAAALEAARGRPQRASKLWKDFKHTSALAPAASAIVKGVEGKPAGKDLKEAYHRAKERPITTALELSGAKAVVGRGLGAGLRVAPSKTLRGVGSTKRPNLKLYDPKTEGAGPEIGRAYSRDVINKAAQKYAERRTRKGSRVRRVGSKKGTQRRPGRDPNVDMGARLVPPTPLHRGHASEPVRRKLKRRLDTRVFSQQRALEEVRHQAIKDAKGAIKQGGERRSQLEVQARADKIRTELHQRLKDTTNAKVRKQLRQLVALSDGKLIREVERRAQPRMGPRTSAKRSYTPEEQATIVKSLDRRARRGQDLTASQRLAVDSAIGHQIARAVTKRRTGTELPGAATARAVVAGALRKIPEGERVRAELRPKPQTSPRVPALQAGDFKNYFENRSRAVGVRGEHVDPTEADTALAGLQAGEHDLVPTAVARAHKQAVAENQALLGKEFGVGPVHKTAAAAKRYAKQEHPGADMVPFKIADGEHRLVPAVVADHLAAHRAVDTGPFRQGGGIDKATGVFKDVVLTTSSPARWLGGNVGDLGMRMLFEGITPMDVARGIGIRRRMGAEGLQGKQARASTMGGGIYKTGGDLGPPTRIGKLNIPRKAWRGWKRAVFGLEGAIEGLPTAGRVGKDLRRNSGRQFAKDGPEPNGLWRNGPIAEFFRPFDPATGRHVSLHQERDWAHHDQHMKTSLRSLLKIHDQQMSRYAHNLSTDRAMEARVQKATEDVIGRWGKVSPGMRRALGLAPFAQWLGAATRYVYVTLPVHHPIKTALLAGISQMTEDERVRLGLSYFSPTQDRAPDYQMGTLPMTVGQNKYGPTVEGVRTSRMTSLGTAGSTPWNLPEFLMPQVSSGLNALAGRSFTGEQLVYPAQAGPGREGLPMDMVDRLPVAAGAQLESMLPFAGAFRRSILEQGRPSEPYSTILTPATRPKFNYKTKQFEERPANAAGGLKEWLTPFAPPSRIYSLGAQRDIERSQQTMEQLKKWNARRKSSAAAKQSYGPSNDSFWGGGPPHPHTVVKPKQTDEFWK